MSYDEDKELPGWVTNPNDNPDEKVFHEWYKKVFGILYVSPRSARYYQMRRAWMASKKHYLNKNNGV